MAQHELTARERRLYAEQFKGHKCIMDLEQSYFLDRHGLFSKKDDFLHLYRDQGFQETDWDHPERLTSEVVFPVLEEMCDSCPHGFVPRQAVPEEKRYRCSWNNCTSSSCPAEQHFCVGTEFHLDYPLPDLCPRCGSKVKFYSYEYDKSPVVLTDIRYDDHPARLQILRQEGVCPVCKQRCQAVRIPMVQADLRCGLTLRLMRAITHHCCLEDEYWEQSKRKVAEGYGLSYSTVKKYTSEKMAQLRKDAERLLAQRVTESISQKKFSDNTFLYCMSLTSSITPPSTPGVSSVRRLYFSYSPGKGSTLRGAFGREAWVLDQWMDGKLEFPMPRRVSEDRLTLLDACYCGDVLCFWPPSIAFRGVQLIMACGRAYHVPLRGRTPDLRQLRQYALLCTRVLLDGDFDLVRRAAEHLEQWAGDYRYGRLFRAARRLLRQVELYHPWHGFFPAERVTVPPAEVQECAERIWAEADAYCQAHHQDWSEGDDEAFRDRLLYANRAALNIERAVIDDLPPIREDGSLEAAYLDLDGIPLDKLNRLLWNGLLDSRVRLDDSLTIEYGCYQKPDRDPDSWE